MPPFKTGLSFKIMGIPCRRAGREVFCVLQRGQHSAGDGGGDSPGDQQS